MIIGRIKRWLKVRKLLKELKRHYEDVDMALDDPMTQHYGMGGELMEMKFVPNEKRLISQILKLDRNNKTALMEIEKFFP